MPWNPPSASGEQDLRLAPYRDRAVALSRDGVAVGLGYVRVELWWAQLGGRLWWRRWSPPLEVVHVEVELADGRFDDWLLDPDDWADELDAWGRGRMSVLDDVVDARWLDDEASARLRVRRADPEHPDPQHR
jgi:hypothetical protein